MTDNQIPSRFPNLGKLSIAILEHIVEPTLGEKALEELKAPSVEKGLRDSLAKALETTEKRFVGEYDDVLVRDAVLSLPLANLPTVLNAVRAFYSRPNDSALGQVLCNQLKGSFPSLSTGRIESGVDAYLIILREELVNLSGDTREKLQAQAILRAADTLKRIETHLASKETEAEAEFRRPVPAPFEKFQNDLIGWLEALA
jgi:hypothetical protein